MQSILQLKIILASQAPEVTVIELQENQPTFIYPATESHLGKHYHNGAGFGQAYSEMSIQIIDRPRNIDTGPVLSDRPVSPKKPSAINVLKMLEKILIRDPK